MRVEALLLALVGVTLLAMRMRHAAVLSAMLGIVLILQEERPPRRCACEKRRWRRRDTREAFTPPPPAPSEPVADQPQPPVPEPEPEPEEDPEEEPEPPSMTADSMTGEITAEHVGASSGHRLYQRLIASPDLQRIDRERLPVAKLPDARRLRLKRIQGVPAYASYRSTTGQTSRFAHLH